LRLWRRRPDRIGKPASVTKLIFLIVVFDAESTAERCQSGLQSNSIEVVAYRSNESRSATVLYHDVLILTCHSSDQKI
jgi:D-alanyl-D-alanine carboxypeptidase